jgi:hypothetical protein
MSILDRAARNTMRFQAAQALAFWIVNVQYKDGRKGITPEDLAELVRGPEPVFGPVLELLKRSPGWDPNLIRSGKAIIADMGQDDKRDDYWQILRQDVLHEHCHEHALLLASPEVWPDFCRQMDTAKQLLLAV